MDHVLIIGADKNRFVDGGSSLAPIADPILESFALPAVMIPSPLRKINPRHRREETGLKHRIVFSQRVVLAVHWVRAIRCISALTGVMPRPLTDHALKKVGSWCRMSVPAHRAWSLRFPGHTWYDKSLVLECVVCKGFRRRIRADSSRRGKHVRPESCRRRLGVSIAGRRVGVKRIMLGKP